MSVRVHLPACQAGAAYAKLAGKMDSLSVQELDERLRAGEKLRIIDVREPEEWAIARLPQAELIPLGQIALEAPSRLDPAETIVVLCHHGLRSARAQAQLISAGYTKTFNLTGGIDAWSRQIDRSVPIY